MQGALGTKYQLPISHCVSIEDITTISTTFILITEMTNIHPILPPHLQKWEMEGLIGDSNFVFQGDNASPILFF